MQVALQDLNIKVLKVWSLGKMANTYEMRVRPKDNVFEYVSWSGWLPASKNYATKRVWNWMAGSYLSSDMGMRLLCVIAKT